MVSGSFSVAQGFSAFSAAVLGDLCGQELTPAECAEKIRRGRCDTRRHPGDLLCQEILRSA